MHRQIDIEQLCADKGLRITEQRRIIAKVLGDSEDHPDVETLHARRGGRPQYFDRNGLSHRPAVRRGGHSRAA